MEAAYIVEIEAQISRRFTIPLLKAVLRCLKLPMIGKKALLQERVLTAVDKNKSNIAWLQIVARLVDHISENGPDAPPLLLSPSEAQVLATSASVARQPTYTSVANNLDSPVPQPLPNANLTPEGLSLNPHILSFQSSPFYELVLAASRPLVVAHPHAREHIVRQIRITLTREQLHKLHAGEEHVFLMSQHYCPPVQDLVVEYPANFYTLVNGNRVYANTRGIKGRAGSANPLDLTEALKVGGRYQLENRVEFFFDVNFRDPKKDNYTYKKSFAFQAFFSRTTSTQQLVDLIKSREPSKASEVVDKIAKMTSENQEAGIECGASVHSLKDPVAFCRIAVAVRAASCSHIDCFDAASFLELQQQAPTWLCPICNKALDFDSLRVDEFFTQVLDKAAPDADQVTINADGSWTVQSLDDDLTDSDDEPPLKRAKTMEIVDLLDETDETEPEPEPEPDRPVSATQPTVQPRPVPPIQPSVPSSQPVSAQASAQASGTIQLTLSSGSGSSGSQTTFLRPQNDHFSINNRALSQSHPPSQGRTSHGVSFLLNQSESYRPPLETRYPGLPTAKQAGYPRMDQTQYEAFQRPMLEPRSNATDIIDLTADGE